MTDLGDHDADPGDHDAPIFVITMGRYAQPEGAAADLAEGPGARVHRGRLGQGRRLLLRPTPVEGAGDLHGGRDRDDHLEPVPGQVAAGGGRAPPVPSSPPSLGLRRSPWRRTSPDGCWRWCPSCWSSPRSSSW